MTDHPMPFRRRRPALPPALTPAQIHAELQRRAPEPPTTILILSERLALAAYRKERERIRKKRDAVWVHDPMFATWMP